MRHFSLQVWVLDARPGLVDPSSGTVRDVGRVLHAVQRVPLPVPSRKWLADHLRQEGFSPGESKIHWRLCIGDDRVCWGLYKLIIQGVGCAVVANGRLLLAC